MEWDDSNLYILQVYKVGGSEKGLMHPSWFLDSVRLISGKEASSSSKLKLIKGHWPDLSIIPRTSQIFCFSHSLLHTYLSPLGVANIIAVLFTYGKPPAYLTFPQPSGKWCYRVGFWYPSHPREISSQLGKGCNPVDVFLEL